MTLFFADTSAVAKRYVTEIGSTWVKSWIEPGSGHLVVISDLTKVEMVSVLARRRREGAITSGDFTLLQNAFYCTSILSTLPSASRKKCWRGHVIC